MFWCVGADKGCQDIEGQRILRGILIMTVMIIAPRITVGWATSPLWCLSNYQHEMSHVVLVPPWHRGTPAVNSRLGVLKGLSFNSPSLHFRLFASPLFSQMSVPCLLPSLSWWQWCLCSIFRFSNVTATLCRYARICTDIRSFFSEWNVLSSHLFL